MRGWCALTVSRRSGEEGFDLVCGQGRLEAYQACGAKEIPALIVDIPLEDRLLRSLGVRGLPRAEPSRDQDVLAMKAAGEWKCFLSLV